MVDILKKAGPLGEKIGSSLGGARNLNFSNPLEAFDKLGFAQLLSGFGGKKSGLSYPLDVSGNPAYNATIRFKVRRYGTPDGKSQKEMDKQIEDNLSLIYSIFLSYTSKKSFMFCINKRAKIYQVLI